MLTWVVLLVDIRNSDAMAIAFEREHIWYLYWYTFERVEIKRLKGYKPKVLKSNIYCMDRHDKNKFLHQ